MLRQSQGALRALQRIQEARRKRDSDPAAADQAAWAEHCAAGFMTEVLHGGPSASPPAPPQPMPAADPPPAVQQEPVRDPIREAEFYAALYPRRAAAIRRHGGMPPDAGFPPPADEILGVLVNRRSAALLAIDGEPEAA